MKQSSNPTGMSEKQIRTVIRHFESQTDEQAAAEDEAAYHRRGSAMIEVPRSLVPEVRRLIAAYELGLASRPAEPKRKISTPRKKEAAAAAHGTNNRR